MRGVYRKKDPVCVSQSSLGHDSATSNVVSVKMTARWWLVVSLATVVLTDDLASGDEKVPPVSTLLHARMSVRGIFSPGTYSTPTFAPPTVVPGGFQLD